MYFVRRKRNLFISTASVVKTAYFVTSKFNNSNLMVNDDDENNPSLNRTVLART